MKRKLALVFILIVITAFLLTSLHSRETASTQRTNTCGIFLGRVAWLDCAGFLSWLGIFNHDIRVYETPKHPVGGMTLAFTLQSYQALAGLGLARRRKHKDPD